MAERGNKIPRKDEKEKVEKVQKDTQDKEKKKMKIKDSVAMEIQRKEKLIWEEQAAKIGLAGVGRKNVVRALMTQRKFRDAFPDQEPKESNSYARKCESR